MNVANPAATSDAEHFGESVGLHGRWAVIGAPQFDVGDQPAQGAVHLYRTNSAGEYELHSMLTASDGSAGNKFGLSVAIRSGILLIGAPHKGAFEYGAAYQYNYVDGSWLETGILDADDQMLIDQIPNERLGTSVAVGTYAGIGGPGSTSSIPGRALVWSLCE